MNAFTPYLNALYRVPIVDTAIPYGCPCTMKSYILVRRTSLQVFAMEMNMILPFILREDGLKLQDIPKIHVQDSTVEDHSIRFSEVDLIILLALYGTLYHLATRRPTDSEIEDTKRDVVLFTHDSPS